jgi:hypothetical protein
MRFFEFAQPQQGESTVSKLLDIAKDPDADPRLKNEILAILKQLEAAGAKADNKPADANPQEQIATESTASATIQTIESDEDYYQRMLDNDPRLKAIAERKIKDAEAAGFNVGSTLSSSNAFEKFNKDILSLVSNLKQLPPAFSNEVAKTISQMAVQGTNHNDLLNFLDACATEDRIIDLPFIVSKSGSGSFPIPKQYQEIVKALALVTPGGSNAASGKGELMLAAIGKDTTKPAVGDIVVGKKRIEVKASDETKGSLTGFALGSQPVGKARTIMVNTVNKTLGKVVLFDAPSKQQDENGVRGISSINTKNLPVLNKLFVEMGASATQAMFREMFIAVVGSKFSEDIDKIVAAIDDKGINATAMREGIVALAFDYYKAVNKHDGLLTINLPNLTYNYVEDVESFTSLSNVTIGSLFDFRDTPSSITTFIQK